MSSEQEKEPQGFARLRGNTGFTRLLVAQVPSDLSDWLDFTAIGALLAYAWSVENWVFALLAVAMGLPYMIVGPLAGVIADRLPTRGVMVWSNAAKALVTASFALAQDWPLLLGLVFLRNCCDAFFTPAKQAALQALTTEDDRGAANGLSLGFNQASKIVAPAIGGLMLAALAPAQVFLINACVSMVAAGLLLRLAPLPATTTEGAGRFWSELTEGWRVVMSKPALRAALWLMALGFFSVFIYDSLVPPLTRTLGFSEVQLGLVLSAVGGGGVLGAILSGRRVAKRPFRQVSVAMALSGLLVAGVGLSAALAWGLPFAGFLVGSALIGITSTAVLVPIRTVIQTETPPSHMARVAALSEAVNTLAILTAPFIGAAIAEASGVGFAFVAGGSLALATALIALRLDRRSPA